MASELIAHEAAIDSEPIRARGIIVDYTMLSKYGNCTRLLKIKNKMKIGCFCKWSREEFLIFCGRF